MLVLGIESSCDETAASVVKDGREVKSSVIASQIDLHKTFGGVVPEIAAREHLKVIDKLTSQCLEEANVTIDDVDAIAVTQGPGLIGALLVGVSYAKGLAQRAQKPLIPVNHVHAHVFGALLGIDKSLDEIFPCIAAVVSGGHTNLYYMNNPNDFNLIAYTIDDACGESFDKVAKLLKLGYPGGPIIERRALQGDPKGYPMPRMMEQKSKMLFSYSGLKTHIVNLVQKEKSPVAENKVADLCAAFQDEALSQLVRKIKSALDMHKDTASILIAGGVAANKAFKEKMATNVSVPTLFPHPKFCGDNAAMIAASGYYMCSAGGSISTDEYFDLNWDAYSRYKYHEFITAKGN